MGDSPGMHGRRPGEVQAAAEQGIINCPYQLSVKFRRETAGEPLSGLNPTKRRLVAALYRIGTLSKSVRHRVQEQGRREG